MSFQFLIFAVVACCVPGFVSAQSDATGSASQSSQVQSPFVRVRSTLVYVPVFVYVPNGLKRVVTKQEDDCLVEDWSAFLKLNADQPYLPPDCYKDEISDLRVNDFSLFQDGQEQKLLGISKESWQLTVRDASAADSERFHFDTSDTPSGQWSSTDITGFRSNFSQHLYLLSYMPDNAPTTGRCYRLQVKVRRPKVQVFARNEYCAGQTPSDLLNGTKEGSELEQELNQKGRGGIPLFLQAGALHNEAGNEQLVDVSVEFPWEKLHHSWEEDTGKLNARIGILGAVYAEDGQIVARFSDLLYPSWWPASLKGWRGSGDDMIRYDEVAMGELIDKYSHINKWDRVWLPTRYETQFQLPPGKYIVRVVLNDGVIFGRTQAPLTVEHDDDTSLSLSSVFLSTRYRDARVAEVEGKAANFAPQYVPLVSKGVEVTPAGDTAFSSSEKLIAYFQIYEPNIAAGPANRIQAHMRLVDAKNGHLVKDFPEVDAATYKQPGSKAIPIAREVPISELLKGQYRLEVQASDAAGHITPWQVADFSIE